MKSLRLVLTILALGSTCVAGSAQKKLLHLHSRTPAAGEQLVFRAEDQGVQVPVGLPEDLKPVLARDEYVQSLLEEKKLSVQQLPVTWFSVASVHLGGHKDYDLVVVGQGPVRGANVTTFWVFCPAEGGWQQALKVSTHTLLLKDAHTRGLREIDAESASAAEVFRVSYRYDGLQYKSYKEVSEPIK